LVEKGSGATGCVYSGLSEFEDMAFVMHFLREGDLFFDIGVYSLLAGGLGVQTIAFEPIPRAYESLLKNLKLNNLEPIVDARNFAISNKKGYVAMTTELDAMNRIVEKNFVNTKFNIANVECETIDNVARDLEPSLFKIDVEGHTQQVLEGAKLTLSKKTLKACIAEWFSHPQGVEFMESFGFKPYEYLPLKRELRPMSTESLLSVQNTLYIRTSDYEAISLRLKLAPHFTVLDQSV